MREIEKLVQVTDLGTGEILKSFGISNADDPFEAVGDKEPTEPKKKNLFKYPNTFVKAFGIKKNAAFIMENAGLFALLLIMAEWIDIDTGLLCRYGEPYTWRHLADEVGFVRTSVYKYRSEMIRLKLIAELKIFGRKYIAVNPLYFGKGEGVPTHISHLFERKNKENENGGRKAR